MDATVRATAALGTEGPIFRPRRVRSSAEPPMVIWYPLLAFLVDAEDADVAHVVVAAGVHAPGDLDAHVAEVVQVVRIVEERVDPPGHGDGLGVGEAAEIQPRAADHVGRGADVRGRESERREPLPQRVQVVEGHVGEQQVLVVGGAHQAEAVALRQQGRPVHLLGGHVARRGVGRLEGDERRAVAGLPVLGGVGAHPSRERGVRGLRGLEARGIHERPVGRRLEVRAQGVDLVGFERRDVAPGDAPFGLDAPAELLDAERVHQDLDAGLVLVVPPPLQVVDPHDRLEVGQEVAAGKELPQHLADDRRAPQSAAGQHLEAERPLAVPDQPQADVVDLGGGAVAPGAGHRDLELARQIGELRVQGGPLAQQLAVRAGVGDLVRGDAGQVVAGDVADAVAAGLDGVHVHRGEVREDVRDPIQGRPVELDVLAGGEVPVAAVVAPGDGGEHPELGRGQDPVGDRDPQHGREALHVEPVHEPQGLELLLAQLPGQIARGLLAELGDPLPDELPVEGVVLVHGRVFPPVWVMCMDEKKAATRFPGWRLSGVRSWLGVPGVGSAWAQRTVLPCRKSHPEFRIQMQQQMKRTKEIIGAARRPSGSGGRGVSACRNATVNRQSCPTAIPAKSENAP